jgi:hypothetical protein
MGRDIPLLVEQSRYTKPSKDHHDLLLKILNDKQ